MKKKPSITWLHVRRPTGHMDAVRAEVLGAGRRAGELLLRLLSGDGVHRAGAVVSCPRSACWSEKSRKKT